MSTSVLGSWADAEGEFSAPDVTVNADGTKTVVTYRLNQDGKKVKVTQRTREVKVQEKVHPLIALRKNWKKFGKEKNLEPGPDPSTTQLGEKVELKLGTSWKETEKLDEEEKQQNAQKVVRNISCRTCGGEHFTAQCPFKDTLGGAPPKENADAGVAAVATAPGKYVPRHLRADANGNLPTRDNRDDSTTLKISQLNTFVDEDMMRNELLARFGPLQRVTIVRNKETGESKGFAYVAFATEELAQAALDALNGKGYHSLILHLEWLKKKKPT